MTAVKKCSNCYWGQEKKGKDTIYFGCYYLGKWQRWIPYKDIDIPTQCKEDKVYYRCANDFWGYCPSPEFDVPGGEHCRLDPETCGKYLTSLQDMRRMVDEKKDELEDWSQHEDFVKLVALIEKKEAEAEVG